MRPVTVTVLRLTGPGHWQHVVMIIQSLNAAAAQRVITGTDLDDSAHYYVTSSTLTTGPGPARPGRQAAGPAGPPGGRPGLGHKPEQYHSELLTRHRPWGHSRRCSK